MEYKQYVVNGAKVNVALGDIEDLRLLQTSSKTALSNLREGNERPEAIINCSYFTAQYPLGRNQGDEKQDTSSWSAQSYLGFALTDEGYKAGTMEYYDVPKSICGFTPACITMLYGLPVAIASTALGLSYGSKMALATSVTMFGILTDRKKCILVASEKGVSALTLNDWLKRTYPIDFLCVLDGGGSTEMIINGEIVKASTDGAERKMFNGIALMPKETKKESLVLDVSKHQGAINFEKMKASCSRVILKLGYTGWGDHVPHLEEKFEQNYADAIEAGMDVGVYYVTTALDEETAQREADFILKAIERKHLTLPIYIDVESADGATAWNSLSKGKRSLNVAHLCETLQLKGYYVGVYASTSWFNTQLDERIDKYDKWVAQYSKSCTYSKPYGMWQYSDSLDGHKYGASSAKIDGSVAYIDFVKVITEKGLNNLREVPDSDCEAEIKALKDEIARLEQSVEFANKLRTEAENAVKAYREILDAISAEMRKYG